MRWMVIIVWEDWRRATRNWIQYSEYNYATAEGDATFTRKLLRPCSQPTASRLPQLLAPGARSRNSPHA